ncbi:unnamed protein product [Adineta steineri]|uniref:Uncharacterized protein n=1 Tax=Adineta steineri TaxID=433720 RepID=A0A820E483_9BILA|nr:unnamed protein product [Adineta steineri]CAF4242582.1 unnamed protein product [Adineta steineri]
MSLLPIAVRWAQAFSFKSDFPPLTLPSNNKIHIESLISSSEQDNLLDSDSIRSSDTLFDFNQTLASSLSSSSSELNLSLISQTIDDEDSLLLSALGNRESVTTEDDNNTSLSRTPTPTQTTSDNESVLYLRLQNELNIYPATLDSDLERIDY